MEVEKPPEVSKGFHRHSGEQVMTTIGSGAKENRTAGSPCVFTPAGDIENCDI